MGRGDTEVILNKPTRHLERLFGDGSVIINGTRYPVGLNAVPSNPTITSVATTDATWTALATGLTNVVMWDITELSGNDIQYAFVAAPGDNFSVAFGWKSFNTRPTNIYIKRPASTDIVVKLSVWSYD